MTTEIAKDATGVQKTENQLVTFLLGDEEFGFNIMNVQEIIRTPTIARMPKTPDYVDGIANLRGVVLPIVDTRTRFGMPRVEDTDRTRVLVIDNDGTKTGLRVDRVKQVTRVMGTDIEPPPAAIAGLSADYLSGVVKLEQGKRIIMELDPAKVCQVELKETAGRPERLKTETASAKQAVNRQTEIEQLVTFKLGREEFAFPIERVREILRVEDPKEVPDTPDYILGILTVRGRIMPIVDLRCLLHQKSLADELCVRIQGLREQYRRGLETAKLTLDAQKQTESDLTFLDVVRVWLNDFNSSNQSLMEDIAKLRNASERVWKTAQTAAQIKNTNPAEYRRLMEQAILPTAAQIVDNLADLEQGIRGNIKDDQRIVVVDADGVLLGLVVDHVNEVLNVDKNLIDPPPHISNDTNLELSGIAKLDDGARLIMLLNSTKLLNNKSLKDIQQRTGAGEQTATDKAVEREKSQMSEQQLVTFRLSNEEFGIPISQVQEIDRCSKITRVPRSPHFVEGITNLRGEVIPVIDARKRFGMEVKAMDDHSRIIIVDLKGTKTGLLVDAVSQVLNLAQKDIAPPPVAINSGVDNEFISGIGSVEDGKRMIVLLNVDKIFSTKEQAELAGTKKQADLASRKAQVESPGAREKTESAGKKSQKTN